MKSFGSIYKHFNQFNGLLIHLLSDEYLLIIPLPHNLETYIYYGLRWTFVKALCSLNREEKLDKKSRKAFWVIRKKATNLPLQEAILPSSSFAGVGPPLTAIHSKITVTDSHQLSSQYSCLNLKASLCIQCAN